MAADPILDGIAPVARIWIEVGCIQCGWCSDLLPQVFDITVDNQCRIRAEVRSDGITDDNRCEHSPLSQPLLGVEANFIDFVAAGCPAGVIKLSE